MVLLTTSFIHSIVKSLPSIYRSPSRNLFYPKLYLNFVHDLKSSMFFLRLGSGSSSFLCFDNFVSMRERRVDFDIHTFRV